MIVIGLHKLTKSASLPKPAIVDVTARWEFEIPTEFLCHVEWAQELIKNETKEIECLIFMSNSYTLRLMDPDEEDSLREKISDAGGFGADVRLSPKHTLHHRPTRGTYRMTIPEEQRPWLSLPGDNRQVCLVVRFGTVEILSMTFARTKEFPKID